jgi:DMSO/TMAO reductase YedYZ molybdopterin-dependent catalytic subunit
MSKLSRRALIGGGLGTVAGASGLTVAARLAGQHGLIPPDSRGIYGVGETLNYCAQRLLMSQGSAALTFDRSQISPKPHINNHPPGDGPTDEAFERLRAGKFADWRLMIDGLVARPSSFSLAQLKSYAPSSHISQLACEEGWSYIAEWTGVPLAYVLGLAGVQPQAKYVVYVSHQSRWWDSIDMPEALHPQTLVTYGMNGQDLPVPFGGPLRLRVPRQLGYKNVKYISRITVTDNLKSIGNGLGSAAPDVGFAWYAGI